MVEFVTTPHSEGSTAKAGRLQRSAAVSMRRLKTMGHPDRTIGTFNWFSTYCMVWEIAMIVLFGTCTEFEHSLMPDYSYDLTKPDAISTRYHMFQDTHVMMILGFGFLYTLMRRYAWSGVGYNYIITVLALQWGILALGFWRRVDVSAHGFTGPWPALHLGIHTLIDADYTAATVLITFGAVIGRISATQAVIMTFIEVIAITGNVVIASRLGVSDAGGSMIIHVFGAAFGLAFAKAFGDKAKDGEDNAETALDTSKHNGTFAMIGTAFLFCFWPSFNAALLSGAAQQRAVINTVLSISASVVSACAASMAINGGIKLDMEHVQNATLAGGVAIGAACDMLLNPWGAILTGTVSGVVSCYGFAFLGPWLKGRMNLTDTCGIASLHLMPGLIGGTASAIAAGTTTGGHWTDAAVAMTFPMMPLRSSRSALLQGGFQMAVTVISLSVALVTGYFTGWLIRDGAWTEPMQEFFYEDAGGWNIPGFEEEDAVAKAKQRPAGALAPATMMHTMPAAMHGAVVGGKKSLKEMKGGEEEGEGQGAVALRPPSPPGASGSTMVRVQSAGDMSKEGGELEMVTM